MFPLLLTEADGGARLSGDGSRITPPLFVAYGIAMTGIGMLTLTGNTISMDVFGPVADNANGVGEIVVPDHSGGGPRKVCTVRRRRLSSYVYSVVVLATSP